MSAADQERLVNLWNQNNPIGTPVLVTMEDGTLFKTQTCSEAVMLSDHTAVIWLVRLSGCCALTRVAKCEDDPRP